LKIAVNARLLLKDKLEGIGRFSYETLRQLVLNHPAIEFHFLFDRPFSKEFIFASNVVPHVVMPPARHPLLWYCWFEYAVPMVLKKIKADLFLSMDGYLSLNQKLPTHLTIHDIAFLHYPQAIPYLVNKYYTHFVPKFVKQAAQIATVSQFSKDDLVLQYKTNASKIDVVYNGASAYFKPMEDSKKVLFKSEHTTNRPYFINVSSIHPRKNAITLIESFNIYKQQTGSNHLLVLIGDFMWQKSSFIKVLESLEHKKDILLLGNKNHEEISSWVAAAEALVYVSLFEGFGIPIIEAMQAGVPVITSNISSMAEVAGNAALLVNPANKYEIAAAMQQIASQPLLGKNYIRKGLQRAGDFSWQQTANLYWQSVQKIM
jgi:glycosyltransferase involved in cell wall biosynthesis